MFTLIDESLPGLLAAVHTGKKIIFEVEKIHCFNLRVDTILTPVALPVWVTHVDSEMVATFVNHKLILELQN